jgi:predicted methyltransferase
MKKLLTLVVISLMASLAVAQLDTAALASAIDNPSRPAEDKERDANRKAPEVLSFLGLEAGMTAMDLIAIDGW